MPFFTNSLRQVLQASVLFLATTSAARSCFFPDGSISKDTPCSAGSGHSSCCGADAFCLDDGLCFGGGILSRGSCTDKDWDSDACAGYCRTESPDTSIAILPCTNDGVNSTFTCGLDAAGCQSDDTAWSLSGGASLVLRPAQIVQLIQPALSSSTSAPIEPSTTAAANATTMYTSGQMAGLGCGLGLPLAFFLTVALCMLYKEKQKHAGPKLMYKLPDNHDEFSFRPPPHSAAHSNMSLDSRFTTRTPDSSKTAQTNPFASRYDSFRKEVKGADSMVHEMDGVSPHEPSFRHELSIKRYSTPTGN